MRLEGEKIKEISFMTDGCAPSVACGSMLTTLVRGISLEEASLIEPEDVLATLDGLSEQSAHCAELAVNTLRGAIASWYGSVRAGNEESRDG